MILIDYRLLQDIRNEDTDDEEVAHPVQARNAYHGRKGPTTIKDKGRSGVNRTAATSCPEDETQLWSSDNEVGCTPPVLRAGQVKGSFKRIHGEINLNYISPSPSHNQFRQLKMSKMMIRHKSKMALLCIV